MTWLVFCWTDWDEDSKRHGQRPGGDRVSTQPNIPELGVPLAETNRFLFSGCNKNRFCWCLAYLGWIPHENFLVQLPVLLPNRLFVFSRSFIASGFPWFGLFRSANCRRSQQKWGWAFGSSRPESLLFRCYVFCFEETALVSPRNGNASTKSEAPQPHQLNFFWDLV